MATITTPKITSHAGRRWWRQVLLGCGVVAPVWWVAMDVVGSLRYEGYSYIDQTISELSAEGAPTRIFMTVLSGIPYAVLLIAFGMGIWITADGRRAEPVQATEHTGVPLPEGAAIVVLADLCKISLQRDVGEETN
jgi:hypothetical protein